MNFQGFTFNHNIFLGWLLSRPPNQSGIILDTFTAVWVDGYRFVTQTLNPKMSILECMFIRQAIDVLEGLIPKGEEAKDIQADHLKKLIVFAIMWSQGALLELDDRKKVPRELEEGQEAS